LPRPPLHGRARRLGLSNKKAAVKGRRLDGTLRLN
jgi:hypothetical protein